MPRARRHANTDHLGQGAYTIGQLPGREPAAVSHTRSTHFQTHLPAFWNWPYVAYLQSKHYILWLVESST